MRARLSLVSVLLAGLMLLVVIAQHVMAADDSKQVEALQGALARESQCRDLAIALLQAQGQLAALQAELAKKPKDVVK